MGIFAHPIFSKNGDFPRTVKKRVAAKSLAQGYSRSRFPELSPEEIKFIRGSSDFFGLNHYTTTIVYRNSSFTDSRLPSYYDDVGVMSYQNDSWEAGSSQWLKVNINYIFVYVQQDLFNPNYENLPLVQ